MSALNVSSNAAVTAVVESEAGDVREVVGTVETTTPNGGGPLPGGVQKVGDFLNTDTPFSPGMALTTVQKVGDLLNKHECEEERCPATTPGETNEDVCELLRRLPTGMPAPAPIGRMGRPVTMTPAKLQQVAMLLSIGFSRRQAAAYLGISSGSITNAVSRDPQLAAELRRAEEISDLQPQVTLMAEARKNWRAAAWYLNFRAKNPRPLSREEKEERHQERLADERREQELTTQTMLGMQKSFEALDKQRGIGLGELENPVEAVKRARGKKRARSR